MRGRCGHGGIFAIVRVIAILVAAAVLPALAAARADAADPPAIAVSGNQLIAGGQQIQLRGVNRNAYTQCASTPVYDASRPADPNDSYADGPVDQQSIDAMLIWGINVVRLPISESCWLGLAGQPSDGQTVAQYQQNVENYVDLLGRNGLYVILTLYSTAPPSDTSGSGPQIDTLPDESWAPAFWDSMAQAFGGDGFVMFDLINEVAISQYGDSQGWTNAQIWSCWLDGAGCPGYVTSVVDPGVGYQSAGMQQLIDAVRTPPYGAHGDTTTPLIIGSPSYDIDKSDFSTYVPTDPADPADPQLIYDAHIYDFSLSANAGGGDATSTAADADTYIEDALLPIAEHHPVLIGELGQQDCDDVTAGSAPFVSGVLDDIDTIQATQDQTLSVLGWTWDADTDGGAPISTGWTCPTTETGAGGPLLITDFNGTPTVMGQSFEDWFQAKVAPISTAAPAATDSSGSEAEATVGDTVTATAGDWSGDPDPNRYTYTWYDCTSTGQSTCTIAAGNTGAATYTVGSADANQDLEVQVTATNGVGQSAPASSNRLLVSAATSSTPPPTTTTTTTTALTSPPATARARVKTAPTLTAAGAKLSCAGAKFKDTTGDHERFYWYLSSGKTLAGPLTGPALPIGKAYGRTVRCAAVEIGSTGSVGTFSQLLAVPDDATAVPGTGARQPLSCVAPATREKGSCSFAVALHMGTATGATVAKGATALKYGKRTTVPLSLTVAAQHHLAAARRLTLIPVITITIAKHKQVVDGRGLLLNAAGA